MIDPKAYGDALFLLCEESGTTDTLHGELKTVDGVLKDNPDYVALLDTPALPAEEKARLIGEAFGTLHTDHVSFLKILSEKHAIYAYGACRAAFDARYDETRGIERVTAVTAVPLTPAQSAALVAKLTAKTQKKILLTNITDPSLLGGIRLRYMGKQIDASLATRLSSLEQAVRDIVL